MELKEIWCKKVSSPNNYKQCLEDKYFMKLSNLKWSESSFNQFKVFYKMSNIAKIVSKFSAMTSW